MNRANKELRRKEEILNLSRKRSKSRGKSGERVVSQNNSVVASPNAQKQLDTSELLNKVK